MRPINIARSVVEKIGGSDHGSISVAEVVECFRNHKGINAYDHRGRHASPDGSTRWFVGSTDEGRRLKIVYVSRNEEVFVKTAYPASRSVEARYAASEGREGESDV
jgi:hypothetical protein